MYTSQYTTHNKRITFIFKKHKNRGKKLCTPPLHMYFTLLYKSKYENENEQQNRKYPTASDHIRSLIQIPFYFLVNGVLPSLRENVTRIRM